ncbi:MFS general substrate transporter [Pilatotrama ljubarskyi]|nr:MFS general substrate transporter [Pilatotrama ljubarskyi]
MYYLFYCIFNVPANVGYPFLPQGILYSFVGTITTRRTLMGLVKSLTLWYPRHMLQWRLGLFWGGATISGAFSGLLAYGISFISGAGGLLGWSWIFIIEGLLTIFTALVAFFVFVDLPETAYFLTPEERSFLIHRLKMDNSSVGEEEHFELRQLTAALCDWKIIVGGILDCTNTTTNPSSMALTVVICSSYSDRIKMRSPFICAGLILTVLGFVINLSDVGIGAKYSALYLVIVGSYQSAPMIVSWLGNNIVGHYKRGIGLAMQVTMSNFGGFIASNVYRVKDAPRYREGHMADLIVTVVGLVLASLTAYAYQRSNIKRDARRMDLERQGIRVEYTAEELKRMGDQAPEFRYTL